MKLVTKSKKLDENLAKVLEHLRNPVKLRILLTTLMLLIGYVGIVKPLGANIGQTETMITRERKRAALADDIEKLRKRVNSFKARIPEKTDPNELVQYMLAGLRNFPLRLVMLDAEPPRELGPYKTVVLKISVEATYRDLNDFLRWLETNPRLMRIDQIKIEPIKSGRGGLSVNLLVVGVMG